MYLNKYKHLYDSMKIKIFITTQRSAILLSIFQISPLHFFAETLKPENYSQLKLEQCKITKAGQFLKESGRP